MSETIRSQPPVGRLIHSVALPSEHGGWGFLIEPILLGLLVAGSENGMLLALSAVGAFLIHQPLKMTLKDRLKGQHLLRTTWAERFTIGYGLMAVVPFAVMLRSANTAFVIPLILAIPFIGVQLFYDARNKSRALIPEVSGAFALAMVAPSVAILGGWSLNSAFVLWLILVGRSLPSILYVRTRLKLEHHKSADPRPAWAAHLVALLGAITLVLANIAPQLAIIAMLILMARALLGLSSYRKPRRAPIIGAQEVFYGLMMVVLVALGFVRGI